MNFENIEKVHAVLTAIKFPIRQEMIRILMLHNNRLALTALEEKMDGANLYPHTQVLAKAGVITSKREGIGNKIHLNAELLAVLSEHCDEIAKSIK